MPSVAELFDLAVRYQRSGNLDKAEALCRAISEAAPTHAAAPHMLGLIAHQKGNHEAAAALLTKAVALDPSNADGHFNLGAVLMALGRHEEAADSFAQAIQLRPNYAAAYNNLGIIRKSQGRLPDAIGSYREALRCDPGHALAHANLGNALLEQGNAAEAAQSYEQALRLSPNHAETLNNLGYAYKEQDRFEEAAGCFRRAIALCGTFADAHHNLSIALTRLGRFDEAWAPNQQALALDPAHARARWQRALLRLLEGDFEAAWPDYEERWHLPNVKRPTFAQPSWDGTPLAGKTILVYAEQGLGDTIQFVRYLPMVKARGGSVLFECPSALAELCAGLPGIDQLLPRTGLNEAPLPPFDVQVPLLDLPRVFGTTLKTIPAEVPYFHADAARVEHWRRQLEKHPGFKAGLAWQGNPGNTNDRFRSMRLDRFAPLARLEHVTLVSLQAGAGAEQVHDASFPIIDLSSRFDLGSLNDLAAAIKCVDLVITVDSAVAHLAGALGVPVWVLLPLTPDWRWLRERTDSPWYPAMRLFRQKQLHGWDQVIAELVATLEDQRGSAGEAGTRLPTAVIAASQDVAACSNQAIALARQGKTSEAIEWFRRVVELKPTLADARFNLGNALKSVEKYEEAAECYRATLKIDRGHAGAWNNLGNVYENQAKPVEAVECFAQALRLAPGHADPHHNLANALTRLNRLDEAWQHIQEAVRLDPNHVEAKWQRGLFRLMHGEFARGWPDFELRWQLPNRPKRRLDRPRWDGSSLAGETILVHAEQGLGDTIQFVRYLPLVKQRGGQVIFECQRPLVELLRGVAGADVLLTQGDPLPSYDMQVPLLSLPSIFGTTVASIPPPVAFPASNPARLGHWRKELDRVPRLRVGIAWQGSPHNKGDRYRSVPLACFEALARLPGVSLVSLQIRPGAEQLAEVPFGASVLDLGNRFDPASLEDLTAVMRQLDLVITVETAVAHLAGSLGVPTWTILPVTADWRWLRERSDSPWYPGMRLFRQHAFGDWHEVFLALGAALASFRSERASAR